MTEAEDRAAATHDQLTGLLSYSGLSLIADQVIARSAREGERLSLACFHVIPADASDQSEHARDASLIELSRFLRANLRASDTVARLTDDELAALLPNTDADQASAAIEQLAAVVVREEDMLDQSIMVEIGISTFDPSSKPFSFRAMLDIARLEMSLGNLQWSSKRPRSV